MKIGIVGTRGIPNNYGGFEQLAEHLSVGLVEKGHHVFVYNSSLHSYKKESFKGVTIITCKDPENQMGTFGQFIYDLNCIRDSAKRNFDVILQLGYTSSSLWSFLFPKRAKLITNMDGLEWKRNKYNFGVQLFLKRAEHWAIKRSDELVADNLAIQSYLKLERMAESSYIAYGAIVPSNFDVKELEYFGLIAKHYYLTIARFEKENNIEMIIEGYLLSQATIPLVIVGSPRNSFGKKLLEKYSNTKIKFVGAIFDSLTLNSLRHFCTLYFHGHSVGGTNPALLEAMAAQTPICAHKNEFNYNVLEGNAFYFSKAEEIATILSIKLQEKNDADWVNTNLNNIKTSYNWEKIISKYEELMFLTLTR